jgi:hypothetical protein
MKIHVIDDLKGQGPSPIISLTIPSSENWSKEILLIDQLSILKSRTIYWIKLLIIYFSIINWKDFAI